MYSNFSFLTLLSLQMALGYQLHMFPGHNLNSIHIQKLIISYAPLNSWNLSTQKVSHSASPIVQLYGFFYIFHWPHRHFSSLVPIQQRKSCSMEENTEWRTHGSFWLQVLFLQSACSTLGVKQDSSNLDSSVNFVKSSFACSSISSLEQERDRIRCFCLVWKILLCNQIITLSHSSLCQCIRQEGVSSFPTAKEQINTKVVDYNNLHFFSFC